MTGLYTPVSLETLWPKMTQLGHNPRFRFMTQVKGEREFTFDNEWWNMTYTDSFSITSIIFRQKGWGKLHKKKKKMTRRRSKTLESEPKDLRTLPLNPTPINKFNYKDTLLLVSSQGSFSIQYRINRTQTRKKDGICTLS